MNVYGRGAWRLTWGLSVLTLLTLGAAFTVISLVLDRYQERQLDVELGEVARAEAVEAPANHFSFASRPGRPASNDVGPLNKYGVMFDEKGEVLSATQPFDVAAPRLSEMTYTLGQPFDFTSSNHTYRGVVVPIPGFGDHRLLLASSRDDLDGDSRFVRHAMGISLLVAVAWLVGAIRWLVRRNLHEHERIAETLHRIATGDIDARVAGAVSDHEIRRVGSDIDEIAGRLDALVGYQRRFIAHAAHELRSPLAALHGEIQQTLRKERAAEDYKRSLAFLLRASGRLTHLAEELLVFARAEHRSAEPPKAESVHVDEALAEVVDSLAPLAREKDVTIAFDNAPVARASVRASRSDVERVLRNLLDNAVRHSPTGGTVTVDVAAEGAAVRVRVRDEGGGVTPSERENVFEPFHRSPQARAQARGVGLGLAIARALARSHGGDVRILEDGPFEFSLPAA